MALRGVSFLQSFLWFRDCGLFKEVRPLMDRREEARAEFNLSLSANGRAAYERTARALPNENVKRAEDTFRAAIAPERERLAQARSQLFGGQLRRLEGKILLAIEGRPEARELRRAVEEFKKLAARKLVANAHKGPRPRLVEIEFVGQPDHEDEYDLLQAPEDLYVVVELPRRVDPGRLKLVGERPRGYAPAADVHALAEKLIARFHTELPPGASGERTVELLVEMLEHPGRHPNLSGEAAELLEELRMLYYSEPIRLVPPEHKPTLREAAAAYSEGLSFAKIAQRLNGKGYKSDQGKPFSAALAEHVVIQALLMLGAWGITETEVDTDS